MEQAEKKKVNVPAVAGAVFGVIVIIGIQQFFFKAPSYDKAMMQAASEINKSCPMMVDKETRLDNAVALPDNVFQYNYTLVNMAKSDLDLVQLEEYMRPNLINTVKTNPDMKVNREHRTTFGYYYKDKNGEFLIKILVTPDLYEE